MRWLDFPPIAEFNDRRGIVRGVRGLTVFGKFEFADRMADIQTILDDAPSESSWVDVYQQSTQLQHAIVKALACWGIDIEWLSIDIIEQLLFTRNGECGWLIEICKPKTSSTQSGNNTLAEALAAISTHCQSLNEALDLANNVPADLLTDTLNAKAGMSGDKPKNPHQHKEQYLKDNFDELMARF